MCDYVVNQNNIVHNIKSIKEQVSESKVYVVVKANGYGIGCEYMAGLCASEGIKNYCVSNIEEARTLIDRCIDREEIVLLLPTYNENDIEWMIDNNITFTICSEDDADKIEKICENISKTAFAHIKVDTGMCRRGFDWRDINRIQNVYKSYPSIVFSGIFTHFAYAASEKSTKEQYLRFFNVVDELTKNNINVGTKHCCNSVATFKYPYMHMDAVRLGSAILGRIPEANKYNLIPTGYLQASIENIKEVKRGEKIGYGSKYKVKHDQKIAVCAVGYYNGIALVKEDGEVTKKVILRKIASNILSLLSKNKSLTATVNTKKAYVVGVVGAESIMFDVTNIDCNVGDMASFNVNPLFARFDSLKNQ